MASPATAAFLAGWRSYNAERMALYKLEIALPTARTIYMASDLFRDPDGRLWEPFVLRAGPIVDPGEYWSAALNASHVRLTLANRKVGYQASGTFKSLLKDYYLEGAALTVYLWSTNVPQMPGYTNFSTDRLQRFKGVVLEVDPSRDGVTLRAEQDIGPYLEQIPSKVVNRAEYASAPAGSLDIPIPVIIGDFRAPLMRSPWSGRNHDYDLAGGAKGTVPGVVTNKGTGAADARVLIAEHKLASLSESIPTPTDKQAVATRRARCGMYLRNSDAALAMEDPSEATLSQKKINADLTGAGADIADQAFIAHAAIPMVDVRTTGSGDVTSGVTNAKAAIDVLDETSYATLTSAGKLVLIPAQSGALGTPVKKAPTSISCTTSLADETVTSAALFGNLGLGPVEIGDDIIDSGSPNYIPQGAVVAVKTNSSSLEMDRDSDDTNSGTRSMSFASYPAEIIIGYRYHAASTVAFRVRWGTGMTAVTGQTVVLPSVTSPSIFKVKIKDILDDATNGWDPATWNFGEKDIIIDVSSAGTGGLDVFFVAIGVRYRPGQNLLASERFHGFQFITDKRRGQGTAGFNQFSDPAGEGLGQKVRRITTPAIYDLSSDFQFNTVGAADDGSGTYTGTANSLIELASDAIYFLLVRWGLITGSDIQTATGVFGSFKGGSSDARALLAAEGMKIAAHIGRLSTVGRVIDQICREAGIWVHRSPFTNKFHCIVWKDAPPAQYDYDRKVRWDDILDGEMRAFRTSVTDVVNALRVKHSYDFNRNRYLGDVFLSRTVSSTGESNGYARDTVREGEATDSYTRFKRREAATIEAEYLRTDAAALSLLRRTFDMRENVLAGVVFQSTRFPDMERGRLIELDADVDANEPYPGPSSDGSWGGKRLWVTEVNQALEGALETQIMAVVDPASATATDADALIFGGLAMPTS